MANNNRLVNSGYPALPYYVNDHGLDSLWSVTIVSGAGVLEAGTVLGRITTAGATLDLYKAYANGNSDGSEVARGILFLRVDATNGDTTASMQTHGNVRSGSLFGIDSAGVTDLTPAFRFV